MPKEWNGFLYRDPPKCVVKCKGNVSLLGLFDRLYLVLGSQTPQG